MSKVWTLTKVLFKCGLGSSFGKNNKKTSSQTVRIILVALVGVCMLPYIFMLYMAGAGGYELLAPAGQPGLVLELGAYVGALVTLIFGIPMVISVFYLSADIEKLIPLPVKPWWVVCAKFLVVLAYEYLMTIVFIGPLFVGYGVASGGGVLYWLFTVLGILCLPVVPLVYASVFAMLLMRIFRRLKNKDFLTIVGTMFGLVIGFSISGLSGYMGGMEDSSAMQALLLEKGNSLAGIISGFFPNFRFLVRGLADESILQMALFLLTIAAVVAAFLWLAQKIYFSGVVGMGESASRARRMTKEESMKLNRRSTVQRSYLKKEWRQMFRTPIYFLNCALMTFIWPVFFAIPLVLGLSGAKGSAEGMPSADELIEGLSQMLAEPAVQGIILIVVFGITVFICSCSAAASTAVSREGKGYYFMKYIPVPYEVQVRAKVHLGIVIGWLGTLLYVLIAGVMGIVLLGLNPLVVVFALVISALTVVMANYLQMLVDLSNPKLTWDNEQIAVKQNMNVMLGMVLVLGACLVLGAAAFLLYAVLPLYAVAGVMCVLLAAADAALYKLVPMFGARKLAELEE